MSHSAPGVVKTKLNVYRRVVNSLMDIYIMYCGRKVMTQLDSTLKSRDITLLTKVHLVKVMVFQVVMYGCESWTKKKAEH